MEDEAAPAIDSTKRGKGRVVVTARGVRIVSLAGYGQTDRPIADRGEKLGRSSLTVHAPKGAADNE